MRGWLWVALTFPLAAFAGCVQPTSPSSTAEPHPGIVPQSFDDAEAEWVLGQTSGCGFCAGHEGFDNGTAENAALWVFPDARIVLIAFNGGWRSDEGEGAVHVAPNISYDGAKLRAMLRDSPREQGGETWVVRVQTARLANPLDLTALRNSWVPNAPDDACTDTSHHDLLRQGNGTIEVQAFTCGPPSGHPFATFDAALRSLTLDVADHGVTQGYAGRMSGASP